MHQANLLDFGCIVRCSKILKRRTTYKEFPSKIEGLRNTRRRWKYWDEVQGSVKEGIFLGYRTLHNGTSEWESEVGYIFDSHESFKAALVCPSDKKNPVYVPLHAIEKLPTAKQSRG